MSYWHGRYRSYPGTYGYDYPHPPQELTAAEEMNMLKNQAEFIQKELDAINSRIHEVEEQALEI
jgi:hypothetical protein